MVALTCMGRPTSTLAARSAQIVEVVQRMLNGRDDETMVRK